MAGLRIRVRGQVQGVGFRPFIWALAREFGLTGHVLNDPDGVLIEVWGEAADFIAAIQARAPTLARVESVKAYPLPPGAPPAAFTIAPSRGQGARTRVTPDAATCLACMAEVFGPGRRQGYAFANCTQCGPRFSILRDLPYDRSHTTMAAFALCPACRAEYENPADRRFHAQPIACPDCGPNLWFDGGAGDPVAAAVALLQTGGIVAIKGLGGFHLACDARNPQALALLRARKQRPAKPFAVMGLAGELAKVVQLMPDDLALLADPAAPVVLVSSLGTLPDAVAPGLSTLGVMLPYTPLHHLLLAAFGGLLVMTSGNLSGEPQVIGNDEAHSKLAAFADGFVMHDRDIARRLDDSVERALPRMVLRRARGRVPGTLPLPPGFANHPVLAVGGQIKSALCLVKDEHALLGHHIGDLSNPLALDEFHKALADYSGLFDQHPVAVACDLHPGYAATRFALTMGLPVIQVQHHHAHMAACMAENNWPLEGGPVAGIVLDGTGFGPDGSLWGGEVLCGDYRGVRRRFWLRPAPLIGGDQAARQPWRNALARLDQAGLSDWADRLFADKPLGLARELAQKGLNTPMSSSVGRLFDAVAACLGLCPDQQTYEGEAAMRLEAMAQDTDDLPFRFERSGAMLDPAPLFAPLCDLARSGQRQLASTLFHAAIAQGFASAARSLVENGEARAVALSGGCFQNPVLLRQTLKWLEGVPVLLHRLTPANDGGLALGQAVVAVTHL